MKSREAQLSYQLVSNIICSFIDFMKACAPKIDLPEPILHYYFETLIQWLENFASNLFNIPENLLLK
jgi:hypothetical protein